MYLTPYRGQGRRVSKTKETPTRGSPVEEHKGNQGRTTMTSKVSLLFCGAAVVALHAGAAFAADDIETMIVTARKVTENAQKIPISITAISTSSAYII